MNRRKFLAGTLGAVGASLINVPNALASASLPAAPQSSPSGTSGAQFPDNVSLPRLEPARQLRVE